MKGENVNAGIIQSAELGLPDTSMLKKVGPPNAVYTRRVNSNNSVQATGGNPGYKFRNGAQMARAKEKSGVRHACCSGLKKGPNTYKAYVDEDFETGIYSYQSSSPNDPFIVRCSTKRAFIVASVVLGISVVLVRNAVKIED